MKNYTVVEMIGCSGVGKTTLLNKVKELLPKDSVLIKNDIFKSFHFGAEVGGFASVYETMMQIKRENISKSRKWITKEQKNKASTFFARELVKDSLIYKNAGDNIIVDDDGLCHNFARVIIDMHNRGMGDELAFLLKNRVVIFVDAPNEVVIENLIKRNEISPGSLNDYYELNERCLRSVSKHVDDSRSMLLLLKDILILYKVGVFEINSHDDGAPIVFLQIVNEALNRNKLVLNTQEFYHRVLSLYTGHWISQPIFKRWYYHKIVADILNEIDVSVAEEVLEIGTVGLQLVRGSHTLDQDKYWKYPGKNPTYNHDARSFPWPLDKKYKVIVALRVFQYLAPVQREAFLEAKKNCEHLIIVVPRGKTYYPKGLEKTYGIKFSQFLEWNDGMLPAMYRETDLGDLYYFKFTS